MSRISLLVAALFTAVLIPATAGAQHWQMQTWHLALEAGDTSLDLSKREYEISDADTSLHLMAGYAITDNFNLVGGYMDMGVFTTDFYDVDADGNRTDPDNPSPENRNATAWTAHAELHREFFDILSLSAGLGLARWRLDISDGENDDTQDTAPLLRLGLGLSMGDSSRLDLTYQEISRLNSRTLALGLRFEF